MSRIVTTICNGCEEAILDGTGVSISTVIGGIRVEGDLCGRCLESAMSQMIHLLPSGARMALMDDYHFQTSEETPQQQSPVW